MLASVRSLRRKKYGFETEACLRHLKTTFDSLILVLYPNLFCDSPRMHPLVFRPTFSDLYASVWGRCPHNKIITAYSSQVDRKSGPRPRKQRHYTCDVFLPILTSSLTLVCPASSMYLCGAELTWLAKNKKYAKIRCRTADTFPALQGKHFQLLMLHIPTHLQVFSMISPAATQTTVL